MINTIQYANIIKVSARYVQRRCKNGLSLPGIQSYEFVGRTWILQPKDYALYNKETQDYIRRKIIKKKKLKKIS